MHTKFAYHHAPVIYFRLGSSYQLTYVYNCQLCTLVDYFIAFDVLVARVSLTKSVFLFIFIFSVTFFVLLKSFEIL